MFIYQSKVNLGEKILFGSIPHLTDPEIRKMPVKACFGTKILHSILVHDLPCIEIRIRHLKQCKLQCHINHGPEWNVEFSIPIQTPYEHFDYCWILKMFDFTKQNFVFERYINTLVLNIGHILFIPQPSKRLNFSLTHRYIYRGFRKNATQL